MRKENAWLLLPLVLLAGSLAAGGAKVSLEEIPVVSFGEVTRFYANETWSHHRTGVITLDHRQCVEGLVRVEGKRTRVRTYTCHMEEGGECLMDQFKSIHGARFCHQFYPWFEREAPYTLHVQFERRPRKFNDREAERRFRRHRFGRQATREVASFQFVRIAPCAEVCREGAEEYTTQVPLQG